jgi:protein-S-isoprenylcysteine O-methyltransferase Ste14
MDQVVQLIGAVLILAAFVLAQMRRMATDSVVYLALNAVGAGLLAVVAVLARDIGFTLLETTWTVVSTAGLVRYLKRGPVTGS